MLEFKHKQLNLNEIKEKLEYYNQMLDEWIENHLKEADES